MSDLAEQITRLWDGRDDLAAVMPPSEARAVVHEAIELLDRGEARVAEVVDGEVVVHEWLKQAILLLFRLEGLSVIEAVPFGLYTDPRYSITYPNGDQVQTLSVVFVVKEWSGDPVADGDETTELGFFPLDGLPTPLYPIHVDTLVDYQSDPRGFVLK